MLPLEQRYRLHVHNACNIKAEGRRGVFHIGLVLYDNLVILSFYLKSAFQDEHAKLNIHNLLSFLCPVEQPRFCLLEPTPLHFLTHFLIELWIFILIILLFNNTKVIFFSKIRITAALLFNLVFLLVIAALYTPWQTLEHFISFVFWWSGSCVQAVLGCTCKCSNVCACVRERER